MCFSNFLAMQLMWLVRLRTLRDSPILKQAATIQQVMIQDVHHCFQSLFDYFNLPLSSSNFLADMMGILTVVNAASILEEDCESKCGRLNLCIVATSFDDFSTKRSLPYAWYIFSPFSNVLRNFVLIVLAPATLVSMLCKETSEDIMMKGFCRAFIKSSIRTTFLSNIRHLRPDSSWWHLFLNGLGFLH